MVTESWVQAGLSPIKRWKCYGGDQLVFAHDSKATGTRMEFAVYVPPQAAKQPWPVLFYLSGLTCTWENATTKAGFQRAAAEHGIVIVAPDTSPRGDDVADDTGYDLGKGAGFYLNATQEPWSKHFRMYDYVVNELTGAGGASFAGQFRALRHHRPFDGRSRRAHHRDEESGPLQVGLGVRADRGAQPGAVGPEGVQRLSRPRPQDVGRVRFLRPDGEPRLGPRHPDRPGRRRRVPEARS